MTMATSTTAVMKMAMAEANRATCFETPPEEGEVGSEPPSGEEKCKGRMRAWTGDFVR